MTEINQLIEFPLRLEDDQILDADGDYICSVFPEEPEIGAYLVTATNGYGAMKATAEELRDMLGILEDRGVHEMVPEFTREIWAGVVTKANRVLGDTSGSGVKIIVGCIGPTKEASREES